MWNRTTLTASDQRTSNISHKLRPRLQSTLLASLLGPAPTTSELLTPEDDFIRACCGILRHHSEFNSAVHLPRLLFLRRIAIKTMAIMFYRQSNGCVMKMTACARLWPNLAAKIGR